jgi:hypothetical protein
MLRNVFKYRLTLRPKLWVAAEENVSDSILPGLGEFEVLFMFKFLAHKHMGNGCHDSSTITIAAVGSDGTAVRHVTQQTAS